MMDKRQRDSLIDELRQEEATRDSLAQMLGYWVLQNKDDVYRAISKLRYMRTSPITEEDQKAAEQQIDRLSHEWNRTHSAFRIRTQKIASLRAKVRTLPNGPR